MLVLIRQTKGIHMGGKLCYELSEIVTNWALKVAIGDIDEGELAGIYKYVDYLLIICTPDAVQRICNGILDRLPGMVVTITTENEKNNSVSYVDINFQRDGEILRYAWHRKAWTSGRMMDQYSAHPGHMKTSLYYKDLSSHAMSITNHRHQHVQDPGKPLPVPLGGIHISNFTGRMDPAMAYRIYM